MMLVMRTRERHARFDLRIRITGHAAIALATAIGALVSAGVYHLLP
jgi:hypothetical protein